MISFASLTIPAGITSIRESRLKSTKPSRLITSCRCAKKAAIKIPNTPPRLNNTHERRLLFLLLSFSSCRAGIRVTGSPLKGEGSREGSVEDSSNIRRRSVDIFEVEHHGCLLNSRRYCLDGDFPQLCLEGGCVMSKRNFALILRFLNLSTRQINRSIR